MSMTESARSLVSRPPSSIDHQGIASPHASSSSLNVSVPLPPVSAPASSISPPVAPPSPTRARSGSFINKIAGNGHSPRRSLSGNDAFLLTRPPSSDGTKDGVAIVPAGPVSAPSFISNSDVTLSGNYDDYEIKFPIGYGSSAVVYSAIYKPLQKRVAIKMIDLDMFNRNQIDELRRETQLMALSKHPNVLKVFGSFVQGSKLYIVTPFLAGGSCLDIMKTSFPDGLDEVSIATILKQALEGLIYFHKNGHIHRDVKAGNLLMDEDGTVLLADFGVSSSCIENGERGVRRTFVGTPCWMAPEVMEQAGYNFKADIWSFGITALELATGHAPFAKFPPLKVLMLTLSNDPPTLERDSTKHKFSKYLKEMIDSCLQKDATKRPSAEKLLQFQFFRQAKKKDHLARVLLAGLPPLEQRPHKRVPQKHNTLIKTSAWNFDDIENKTNDPMMLIDDSPNPNDKHDSHEQGQQNGRSSPTAEKRHIRFDVDAPPSSDRERKHISFGDPVIRSMSTPTSPQLGKPISEGEPRKSRFLVEDPHADLSLSSHSLLGPGTPLIQNKDSDLYLGLGVANVHVGFTEEPKRMDRLSNASDKEVVHRKGRFSVTEGSGHGVYASAQHGMPPRSITPGLEKSQSYNDATCDNGSLPRAGSTDNLLDRRSRFEVMGSQNMMGVTAVAAAAVAATTAASAAASTPVGATSPYHSSGVPLSRENSSSRDSVNPGSISRESSLSRGRFSVEKDGSSAITMPSPQMVVSQGRRSDERDRDGIETPSCGVGKRGRFEVSNEADGPHSASAPGSLASKESKQADGSHSDGSSQSGSIGGSPSTSPSSSLSRGHSLQIEIGPVNPYCSQLETLIRQNEQQHVILSELFYGMGGAPKSGGSTVSQSIFPGNGSSIHSGQQLYGGHWGSLHIGEKVGAQTNGVRNLNQEDIYALSTQNQNLLRENDSLKKEIERLRRSMSATSINVAGGATSNAASVDAATPYPILVNGTSKSSSNVGVMPLPTVPALPASVKFEEKPKENLSKFEERRDP